MVFDKFYKQKLAEGEEFVETEHIVCAFKMTKASRQDNSDWPNWLNQAWNLPHDEPGCVYPENFPDSDGQDKVVVVAEDALITVPWGHWLVCSTKDNLISVMTATAFSNKYEET